MPDLFEAHSRVRLLAGVDEVGRGPLAGDVVAAAVILDPDTPIEGLRDSKKLTAQRRESLALEIRDKALAWALVKIYQRGTTLGMVKNNSMDLPYTQRDMADALGLSLVHTNKTLAKLRDRQLASWSDHMLQINDLKALAEIAKMELDPPLQRPLM